MARYILFLIKALNETKVIADLFYIINEHNHGHSGWIAAVDDFFYAPRTKGERVLSYRLFQTLLNCAEKFEKDIEAGVAADISEMTNLVQKLLKYDNRQIGRKDNRIISRICYMLRCRARELNATDFEKLEFTQRIYLPFPNDLFQSSRRKFPRQYSRLYQILRNDIRDFTEEEIERIGKYRQKARVCR